MLMIVLIGMLHIAMHLEKNNANSANLVSQKAFNFHCQKECSIHKRVYD